ncbi:MAG: TIGR04282 family arsenosugar biosynthesis glycosyltransferase [Acetobacteraceae bacterium]|jgi:rSAM/selenodomain-associated transferase 1
MARAAQCAIAVMAKAPRPNHVKTRLVPPLTPHEAAALNACFLRDMTENIREAARAVPMAGFVAYAPAGCEALFDGMLAPGTALVLADGSIGVPSGVDGFGRSLLHAATSLLARGYSAVCLVNSDSPTLPTAFLLEAAEVLARPGDRMVLGAAEDGGYYMIGLKAPHAALFRDVTWSTDQVSAQTLAQAATLGLEVVMLPSWFDVDDPASLTRLVDDLTTPRHDGPLPYAAPATRAWLEHVVLAERLIAKAPPERRGRDVYQAER